VCAFYSPEVGILSEIAIYRHLMAIHLGYRETPGWKLSPVSLDDEPHYVPVRNGTIRHSFCTR
jgi:hypothetical protein